MTSPHVSQTSAKRRFNEVTHPMTNRGNNAEPRNQVLRSR